MALVVAPAQPLYVGDDAGKPRADNGEALIASVMETLSIDHLYEAFLYPIRVNDAGECTFGFRPDFWLPATTKRPECHIEVTWPDIRGRQQSNPRRHRSIDQVIREKQAKICTVYRVYGVPTLLLDYRACRAIERRYCTIRSLLDRLHDLKDTHEGFYRPAAHHF